MKGKISIDKLREELKRPATLNGREDFKEAAVLVPLIKINEELHILFEKRSSKITQGGEVSFPGGRVDFETDKDSMEAAVRETIEEIGAKEEEITVLGQLDMIFMPTGVVVDAYVGILNVQDFKTLKVSKDEVDYLFVVPLSYFIETTPEVYETYLKVVPSMVNSKGEEITSFPAKELGLPENYHKPWGNAKHKIHLYRYNDEIIWGATAKIINDLKKRIAITE
ncbi:MAG: CoA pyrophosphatase [Clostridiaceae bacterium]